MREERSKEYQNLLDSFVDKRKAEFTTWKDKLTADVESLKTKENKTLSTIKEKKESFKKHMDKHIQNSKESIKKEITEFRNVHDGIVELYHKQYEERKKLLDQHNKVYILFLF